MALTPPCPECGDIMRECRTNYVRPDGVHWYAKKAHGYKCLACSEYFPADTFSQSRLTGYYIFLALIWVCGLGAVLWPVVYYLISK